MDRIIVFLNRLFRRPNVQGRESQTAYSDWEYRVGREAVRDYLEPRGDLGGRKVLDVGCGLGGKTVAYAQAGAAAVYGTDLDHQMVTGSHKYSDSCRLDSPLAFFVADAARLPLADETIDTVISNDAMEHFRDPDATLAEMVRVTQRGGVVWVFFTPHFSPRGSHLYDYIYTPWCHLLFRRRDLEAAVRRVITARVRQNGSAPGGAAVEDEVRRVMDFYDNDLNRMSIRRFLKMVDRHPELAVTYKHHQLIRYRFLRIVLFVPVLRELLTGNLVCRLEKVS